MTFTWPMAFAVVGLSISLFTYLFAMLNRDKAELTKKIQKPEHECVNVEKLHSIEKNVSDLEVRNEYLEKQIKAANDRIKEIASGAVSLGKARGEEEPARKVGN